MMKLKTIDHPNSLKVISVPKKNYDLLEKCHMGELFDLIAKTKGGFSETATRVVISHIITSYKFLHGLNLSHNDLKSENIVLDKEFNCKIIDFGCSSPINKESKD